jgi:hypothetical protein
MTNEKGPSIKKKQKCIELRGQRPAEEGRQSGKMPALRRDGIALSFTGLPGSNNERRPKALTISHKSGSSLGNGKTDNLAVNCSFGRIHP